MSASSVGCGLGNIGQAHDTSGEIIGTKDREDAPEKQRSKTSVLSRLKSVERDFVEDALYNFCKPLRLKERLTLLDKEGHRQDNRLNAKNCFIVTWATMLYALCFFFFICLVVQTWRGTPEVEALTFGWEKDLAPLPNVWVKLKHKHAKIEVLHCAIMGGNRSGYHHFKHKGIIDPQYGGCKVGDYHDLSKLQSVDVEDGGCKHYPGESTQAWCYLLQPEPIVGQYGQEHYEFTKVTVLTPDPASIDGHVHKHSLETFFKRTEAKIKVQLVYERPKSIPAIDGEKRSFETDLFSGTLEKAQMHEIYFQRRVHERYTNAYLGARWYAAQLAGYVDPDRKISSAYLTRAYRDYPPWSKHGKLETMNIFLRAAPSQVQMVEHPFRTWLKVPIMMGGFYTGFIIFTAVTFKTFLHGFLAVVAVLTQKRLVGDHLHKKEVDDNNDNSQTTRVADGDPGRTEAAADVLTPQKIALYVPDVEAKKVRDTEVQEGGLDAVGTRLDAAVLVKEANDKPRDLEIQEGGLDAVALVDEVVLSFPLKL